MIVNNITFFFFCIALSVGATTLFSCKPEQVPQTKDLYIPNADSILSRHNAQMPEWDQANMTHGTAEILIREGNLIVIHVPEQGNETMYYALQTENKKHNIEHEKINRAEVIFLGRSLIVNSLLKKQTLYFHLETDPIPDDVKAIGKVKSFKGFGIGVRKIPLGSPGDKAPYCACDHSYTPPGNCKAGQNMDMNCASGNEYGSCKVTCVGQTYACCDRGFDL